jgi:predicted MFS family arabinose efflux permease
MAKYVHSLLLFPSAFATLVLSKAYGVAKAALVPAVVESDEDLVQANSRLTVGGALVGLVAAIPGVAVLKLLNAAAVLRLASAVFVVGGIAAFRIAPAREDRQPSPDEVETRVNTRTILAAAGVMAVLRGAVGFLTFLLAFDLRRTHAAAPWFGVVLLASVGGGLAGAAIAPKLRDSVKEERIVVGALVFVVVGGFASAFLGGRGSAALLAGVVGFSGGIGKLAFDSLVQRDAHEAARGRSFARFEAAFQLAWVVGALIPVLITIGDTVGFFILAVGSAAAAVAYIIVRTQRPEPEVPAPVEQ